MTPDMQQIVAEAITCLSNCNEELAAHGRKSQRIERAIDGLRRIESATTRAEGEDGDGVANCAECGAFLEHVRPGKYQHPTCSHYATPTERTTQRGGECTHLWSAPSADGSRECLWCFKVINEQPAATPQAQEGMVLDPDVVLTEYARICIEEHHDDAPREARVEAMRRALTLAAAPEGKANG